MDFPELEQSMAGLFSGFSQEAAMTTPAPATAGANANLISAMINSGVNILTVIIILIIVYRLACATLTGALAKNKGYAFFGNFIIGLLFGMIALIYEAGRVQSFERECVMQNRLAHQSAKELYRLQYQIEKMENGVLINAAVASTGKPETPTTSATNTKSRPVRKSRDNTWTDE